ncbi:activity-dependent neuroprotector homeobox protein 2-like [Megalops cyprinoides]|uniref:activity-dependent neuroprotector homeobox protein 2-like n=1 Tax=Megalops cyprinoides TaxID=118141 RepID=UPI0018654F16|nr:activity-dependent neuroprotector homeobox protein 2-like [Megalops cyprinoides]
MLQLPVCNLEKIRKSRKRVKDVLYDIGLENCKEVLQELQSFDAGDEAFHNTDWYDFTDGHHGKRRKKWRYRTRGLCCTLCRFSARSWHSYRTHILRCHEEEQDLGALSSCSCCSFVAHPKVITQHFKIFHPDSMKTPNISTPAPGVQTVKGLSVTDTTVTGDRFSCRRCGYQDSLIYCIKKHVLVNHYTNLLNRYFGQRTHVEIGAANDTRTSKFYCKVCSVPADSADHLIYHILTSEKHKELEVHLKALIYEHSKLGKKTLQQQKLPSLAPKVTQQIYSVPLVPGANPSQPGGAVPVQRPAGGVVTRPPIAGTVLRGTPSNTTTVVCAPGTGQAFLPGQAPTVVRLASVEARSLIRPGQAVATLQNAQPQKGISVSLPTTGGVTTTLVRAPVGTLLPTVSQNGPKPLPLTVGVTAQPQQPRQVLLPPGVQVSVQGKLALRGPAPQSLLVTQRLPVTQTTPRGTMLTSQSLFSHLIPTGNKVNGLPTYTLAPVQVTVPVQSGAAQVTGKGPVAVQSSATQVTGKGPVVVQSGAVQMTGKGPVAVQSSAAQVTGKGPVAVQSGAAQVTTKGPMGAQSIVAQVAGKGPVAVIQGSSTTIPLQLNRTPAEAASSTISVSTAGSKLAQKWITCPVCKELFPADAHQTHMETAHGQAPATKHAKVHGLAARAPFLKKVNGKILKCLTCNISLSGKGLFEHLLHGLKCLHCPGMFYSIKQLLEHTTKEHSTSELANRDFMKREYHLHTNDHGDLLVPHFDINTTAPKELLGDKELNLALVTVSLDLIYVKVLPWSTHPVCRTPVKTIRADCPFCPEKPQTAVDYELHLKTKHHIIPTIHAILKSPAFKCVYCSGVYTGKTSPQAISTHVQRCRCAPKTAKDVERLINPDPKSQVVVAVNGGTQGLVSCPTTSQGTAPLPASKTSETEAQLQNKLRLEAAMKAAMEANKQERDARAAKRSKLKNAQENVVQVEETPKTPVSLILDPTGKEMLSFEDRKRFLTDYFNRKPYLTKRETETLAARLWFNRTDVACHFGTRRSKCMRSIQRNKTMVLLGFNMTELRKVKHNLLIPEEPKKPAASVSA